MIAWVLIEANPPRQFYCDPRALPHLDPQLARHQILLPLSAIRSDAEGEDANLAVTLDNRCGEASGLLAQRPPIGARARVLTPGGQVFAGVVAEIRLDATGATLSIEA